jgi:large subunit ribosomal protein L6
MRSASRRIRAFIVYARTFSTSLNSHAGHPCYIGRAPVLYPPSVTLIPTPTALRVNGPLGKTTVPLEPYMTISMKNPLNHPTAQVGSKGKTKETGLPSVSVSVAEPQARKQRSMWGLTRTLIANAITGMTEGFTVPLHLVGVGYRAALEPDPRPAAIIAKEGGGASGHGPPMRLNMKLGYSHSVFVPIPPYIKAEVPIPTRIMLSCNDKQKLGLFAAKVRNWRKPEPYKGKVCYYISYDSCPILGRILLVQFVAQVANPYRAYLLVRRPLESNP